MMPVRLAVGHEVLALATVVRIHNRQPTSESNMAILIGEVVMAMIFATGVATIAALLIDADFRNYVRERIRQSGY